MKDSNYFIRTDGNCQHRQGDYLSTYIYRFCTVKVHAPHGPRTPTSHTPLHGPWQKTRHLCKRYQRMPNALQMKVVIRLNPQAGWCPQCPTIPSSLRADGTNTCRKALLGMNAPELAGKPKCSLRSDVRMVTMEKIIPNLLRPWKTSQCD